MKRYQSIFIFFLAGLFTNQLLIAGQSVASWVSPTLQSWVKAASSNSNLNSELKSLVSQVNQNVGLVAAETIGILQKGVRMNLNNNSSGMQNATYYGSATSASANFFLTLNWLNQFASLLTSGTPPYDQMNSFHVNRNRSVSDVDRNYLQNHLAPALQQLSQNATVSIDPVGFNINISFDQDGYGYNAVIISTINNNTQQTFQVYQGSVQIGTVNPGVNSVALYGAAQSAGDIVFYPTTGTDGSFRISFKQGSDIINIANTTAAKPYSTTKTPEGMGNLDDNFVCVQITAADFPSGTAAQIQSMIQRTQCINLSQLSAPTYVTLQIEDNMTICNNVSVNVLNQSNIPMYYSSFASMIVPLSSDTTFAFPYLVLPDSLQKNATISGWIGFLNLIIGVLQTNYGLLAVPSYVSNFVTGKNNLSSICFLAQDIDATTGNVDPFGNISTPASLTYQAPGSQASVQCVSVDNNNYSIQNSQAGAPLMIAYAGLPGTQMAGDIPSAGIINAFCQLNAGTVVQSLNQVPITLTKSMTTSNLLLLVESFWKQFIVDYQLVAKPVSGTSGLFTIQGKQNAAKVLSTFNELGSWLSYLGSIGLSVSQ